MSIEQRIGDIFEQDDINFIVHQANCFCTMGSGIAKIIKDKFPTVYEADCKTGKGDGKKLGTYSWSFTDDSKKKIIANVYGQYRFGNPDDRDTQYDFLYDGLKKVHDDILRMDEPTKYVVGIPYGMGCDRAGGKWKIVSAILASVFDKSSVKAIVVRLPNIKDFD